MKFKASLLLGKLAIILIALITFQSVSAQNDEVLTNASIVELTQAGIGAKVIVQKIKSSPTNFDVSTKALAALKKEAAVDPDVMNAMMVAGAKDKMANANPNDPLAPHPAGIYYFNKAENKMVLLVEGIYEKDNGLNAKNILIGSIARDNDRISLDGGTAKLQLNDPSPVFYLYTESNNGHNSHHSHGGHNSPFGTDFTPNELVLATMDAHKNSRNITTSTYNIISGTKKGVDSKASFEYEKLSDNSFKIYFNQNMKPGEYGFCTGRSFTKAGSSSDNKVFDFGVH